MDIKEARKHYNNLLADDTTVATCIEWDALNYIDSILSKIEEGKYIEPILCKDCKHFYCLSAIDRRFYCRHQSGLRHVESIERESSCSYAEAASGDKQNE